jgi:thioredoxin 1
MKKKKNRNKDTKVDSKSNAGANAKKDATKVKSRLTFAILGVFVALAIFGAVRAQFSSTSGETVASTVPSAPAKSTGKVTMIDLGATECIPCKMMAPILEELKKEYAGKADIVFIDVWKNPSEAKKYGVRAIPTQIFFDAEGKEVHRNTGFMDKKRIVEILTRMGVS